MHETKQFEPPVAHPGAKPRLLLVEDDVSSAKVYARVLKDQYDVTLAEDGIKATTILQDQSFDIILSDVFMPGISGVELLRLIRTYDLEVPVLLMTAAPNLADVINAVDLGAIGYLVKPFDIDELRAKLAKGLALGRFGQARRRALEVHSQEAEDPRPPPSDRVAAGAMDRAAMSVQLDRAIEGMYLVFQPIVKVSERRIVAYEALRRTREPSVTSPCAILDMAEKLRAVG